MVSGFFLGGMAPGITQAGNSAADAMKQQGLQQIQLAQIQLHQKNIQRAEFMDLRSQAITNLQETIGHLKDAHPEYGPMQLANHPAVKALSDMIGGFDKNLKLPDTIGQMVAGMVEGKGSIATAEAKAKATGEYAYKQSEINRNNASAANQLSQAAVNNPDGPAPGQGLGDPKTANQRVSGAFNQVAQAGGETETPSAEAEVRRKYDPRVMFKAEQLLDGNTAVLSGLGYGKVGAAARRQVQDAAADLAIARGMKPEDVNANVSQFMGQKRAASAAGLRVGNVTVALDASEAASKRVIETNEKVAQGLRTQYPALNGLVLSALRGTGDESVIQYGIALNTLVNNYARAVGGGNAQLTDTARQEAWQNLNASWSKGQIKAAVEQINKEIKSELSGAQKAMKDVTKKGEQNSSGPQRYKFNPNTGELE